MKHFLLLLIPGLLLFSNLVKAQEATNISDSRKKNIKSILDYRFKGGYYSFERMFTKTVEYPEMANQSCVMGIVVASFEVDCKGEIVKLTMKNMLRFGIDQQITSFFNETTGMWNTCDDPKYTKFDVPIQFRLEGVETNTEDAMLIKEAEPKSFDCKDDAYYLERAEKYLEKGKGKKALQNIYMLIQRNPYNTKYSDMRNEAIALDNQ